MRKLFSEKAVMSFVMVILISFVVIAGTIAWFVVADRASVKDMNLNASEVGVLYVDIKIKPYKVDLEQEDIRYSEILTNEQLKTAEGTTYVEAEGLYEINRMALNLVNSIRDEEALEGQANADNIMIDMGQPHLNSIEDGKLGPGAFGEVILYILTENETYADYYVQIVPELKMIDESMIPQEIKEADLTKLVADHIRFYEKRTEKNGENRTPYDYENRIQYVDLEHTEKGMRLEGTLTANQEKTVSLYWYWPYEYIDIPKEQNEETGQNVEENGSQTVSGDKEIVSTTSTDIESYDLGDTRIGNYVKEIIFHFSVNGYTAESENVVSGNAYEEVEGKE